MEEPNYSCVGPDDICYIPGYRYFKELAYGFFQDGTHADPYKNMNVIRI